MRGALAVCSFCHTAGAKLKCDACLQRRYCNRKCQKRDWKTGHRDQCKAPQQLNAAGGGGGGGARAHSSHIDDGAAAAGSGADVEPVLHPTEAARVPESAQGIVVSAYSNFLAFQAWQSSRPAINVTRPNPPPGYEHYAMTHDTSEARVMSEGEHRDQLSELMRACSTQTHDEYDDEDERESAEHAQFKRERPERVAGLATVFGSAGAEFMETMHEIDGTREMERRARGAPPLTAHESQQETIADMVAAGLAPPGWKPKITPKQASALDALSKQVDKCNAEWESTKRQKGVGVDTNDTEMEAYVAAKALIAARKRSGADHEAATFREEHVCPVCLDNDEQDDGPDIEGYGKPGAGTCPKCCQSFCYECFHKIKSSICPMCRSTFSRTTLERATLLRAIVHERDCTRAKPLAMHLLADLCSESRQYEEENRWRFQAAALGCRRSQYCLGGFFQFRIYMQLAELHGVRAASPTEQELRINCAKAIDWYAIAADNGHLMAKDFFIDRSSINNPGMRVKVFGLTTATHFNGMFGYVTFTGSTANSEKATKTGRQAVLIDGEPKAKLLKEENLELVVRDSRS